MTLGLMQLEMQLEDARLQSGGASSFAWIGQRNMSRVSLPAEIDRLFPFRGTFLLVRAPCVGGMYVANIGAISSQGSASSGLVYLLIYNLGIALPVLILGGIVTLGMSPEQVDQFRQRHRVAIRLLTGITLIALAPLIYWQMI